MGLNSEVSFIWLGHGTWRAKSVAGRELLLDAFVQSNPATPEELKKIEKLDIVVVTHGHADHVADLVEIAKATQPTILCPHELGGWLAREGITEKVIAFAKGGTVEVEGISFTMVHAEHCSSMPDGSYGSEAVGYVIAFENGFKIYFAGDTDVFGDMALIRELEAPEVAFLPIGDFYTMGPRRAAKAVELLGVKTVVPMHYGTFPVLRGRPEELRELLGAGVEVVDIKPGEKI